MDKQGLFLYDNKGAVVRQVREKRDGLYDIGDELLDVDFSTLLDYAAEKRLEIHGGIKMKDKEIERLDRLAMVKKAQIEESDVERFQEIMDEIEELVEEAYQIVQMGDNRAAARRAEAYWKAQIPAIVSGRGSMVSMRDTILELSEEAVGDIEDMEDDGQSVEERREQLNKLKEEQEG
jgi:hypothetical protein